MPISQPRSCHCLVHFHLPFPLHYLVLVTAAARLVVMAAARLVVMAVASLVAMAAASLVVMAAASLVPQLR
jgi:hypothetical protein